MGARPHPDRGHKYNDFHVVTVPTQAGVVRISTALIQSTAHRFNAFVSSGDESLLVGHADSNALSNWRS